MKYILPVFTLLMSASLLGADDPPPREVAIRQEMQKLQGVWQVESWEQRGKKAPAADLLHRTVFFGGETYLVRQDLKMIQVGRVRVDPTKTPKPITVQIAQGQHKGEIMLGIFELQGDTLKICFDVEGQNRPAEFKADGDAPLLLLTCKRRKVDEPPPAILGKYKATAQDPSGAPVTAETLIERHGEGYRVTWKHQNNPTHMGFGIRTGNVLSVCWVGPGQQAGLTVYRIEDGPKLVGHHSPLGGPGLLGEETLTPVKEE